jgi:hypothetical protein
MKITTLKPKLQYRLGKQEIDSIDLKAMLVSRGVRVSKEIYQKFNGTARLSKNPLECNSILLLDGTVIQLTDLSFHMEYISQSINWGMLKQLKYLSDLQTDFSLRLDANDNPSIYYKEQKITPVHLPEPSNFYKQKTSSGLPFLGNAVLQGSDWLSFPLLWKCDYAWEGQPCQYCFSGGELASLSKKKKPIPNYPTPEDVSEIVEYAMVKEHCANSIQITGGSMFDDKEELAVIKHILNAINKKVGRENIKGEIVVYITPPRDPKQIDEIFDLGVDRVSCSLEIWDEERATMIMPGKMHHTGRKRILDCLHYISSKYGKNKGCCNFIIGLEELNSVLEGAEYMASIGIVPISSVWIPFGRPVLNSMKPPDLAYLQTYKQELSRIYKTYGIVPPGGNGLNVCFCRDIYLNCN